MSGHGSRTGSATVHEQVDRATSPWSRWHRLKTAGWEVAKAILFRSTPKPLYPWRLWLVGAFGGQVRGPAFLDATADIKYPWKLQMAPDSCVGPKAVLYNLGHIELKAGCVIAQEAYLCTGTHDLEDPALPLVTAPIVVGQNAFVGVRALILPGVHIGEGAVVGAGAVVTKDVPPWTIVAGNPAVAIGTRRAIPLRLGGDE